MQLFASSIPSKAILCALFFIANLTSCSSPGHFNSAMVKNSNYQQNNTPLYADLKQINGKWQFVNINANSGDVKLGTYERSSLDVYIHDDVCFKSLWGSIGTKCSEHNFIENNAVVPSPLKAIELVVLSPIWVLLGFPTAFEPNFSWDKYHSAVNEAKANQNFDSTFMIASDKYDKLQNSIITKSSFDKMYAQGKKELESALKDQIQIKVINSSGLQSAEHLQNKYSQQQLRTKIETSVNYNKATEIFILKEEAERLYGIGDAKTIDEFSLLIDGTNDYIRNTRKLNMLSDNTKDQNHKILVNQLKYGTGVVNTEIDESYRSLFLGYNVDTKSPENIFLLDGKLIGNVVIPIYIKSKDYKNVLPSNYHNENPDIQVSLTGKIISLVNNTSNYISLDALSLYHNSNILTKDNYDIEIPPNGVKTLNLNVFNLKTLQSDYYNLTQKRANNEVVDFGFALKYTITEENKHKSLYKTKKYKLADII